MEAASDPILVSIEEAARLLNVGRTTMYALMDSEKILTIRVGARRLVPVAAIEGFVADCVAEASGNDAA